MFGQVQVPVLGIVENMAAMACPHCGESIRVFPGNRIEDVCRQENVAFLGSIPLDPEAALGGDQGLPVLLRTPESPAAEAFRDFAAEENPSVRELYRENHAGQTFDFVTAKRDEYLPLRHARMGVWEAIAALSDLVLRRRTPPVVASGILFAAAFLASGLRPEKRYVSLAAIVLTLAVWRLWRTRRCRRVGYARSRYLKRDGRC